MNKPADRLIHRRLARSTLFAMVALGLLLALDGIGLSVFSPNSAQAQNADPALEEKSQWQEHYRIMLKNQAILADNAAKLRKNYAQAQRRNYPRGGARDKFILDAVAAEADLAELKKETADLLARARREDLPRSWFYEVDDEDIQLPSPAARGEADAERDASRDGRNPLYLD